jgi:DNA segregation ATPase FtsK/SpoIIIE, S-DNA-T family
MQIHLSLSTPRLGRAVPLVLDADPQTPLSEIIKVLNEVEKGELYLGTRRLGGKTTLAKSGIRDGSVITVGEPTRDRAKSDLELAVVGGPTAGVSFSLPIGVTTVGSGRNADIQVLDKHMSRAHLKIKVWEIDEYTIFDMHSKRGTFVEGERVEGRYDLRPGDVIRAGASLLEIRLRPDGNADLRTDEEGHLVFNRPARIWPKEPRPSVTIPSEPQPPEKQSFPWVQALAPLILSMIAALVFKNAMFLLFSLMAPIMVIGSRHTSGKDNKARYKKQLKEYEEGLEKAEVKIDETIRLQTRIHRFVYPDPTNLLSIGSDPRKRLWERRRHDEDFLFLRTGAANQDADIDVKGTYKDGDENSKPTLDHVPVGIDLKTAGVMGIAGPADSVRASARWLIGQIATLHSPSDAILWMLTDRKSRVHWEWMRWLPHTRFEDFPDAPFANIATDKYQREEHVRLLVNLMAARKVARENEESVGPAIVVIYDGMRALRNLPAVGRLLKEGPGVGIYAIGLEDDPSRLAEEGNAEVVMNQDGIGGVLRVKGEVPIYDLLPDQVTGRWATALARGLGPMRQIENDDGERSLPGSVRLVDMLGIDLEDPAQLVQRWSTNGRTTSADIGYGLDGIFALDLKRDGPHGLVAGTTGSGKSEFLQTMVVSLALANRPDAMNFVLVDYKGASAFADCDRLPHTVGMVTNLDGHLTERALTALDAELKRREHALKELQSPDVDTAWSKNPTKAATLGLARLVIVIDEFAELVHELPDFVKGLIRIARVGRSLGVHLVLATQRPTGVVSAEMRANTGLRIALRMEDRQDSTEVIDKPDAAAILRTTPGRAYARLGGGTSLIPFQTARVAGKRKDIAKVVVPPSVIPMPWPQLGRPLPKRISQESVPAQTTDLHGLVELIKEASQLIDVKTSHSPWLPPLPEKLFLAANTATGTNGIVEFGLEDRPSDQVQVPATFDVANGSHMAIAGSPRSGRSTALRTLAGAIARTWHPSDCHIYGLDFGNGALLSLAQLPHCGAVATRVEGARLERLISRLLDEVALRQELFARLGVGDINEQRSRSDQQLPYIVVFFDLWEGMITDFALESGSDMQDRVLRLLREGPGVGIKVIISGDKSVLNNRVSSHIDRRLILRLSETEDYRIVGINPKHVSEEIAPGRALRPESMIEVQFGVLSNDLSASAQTAALAGIAELWQGAEAVNRPFRVDALPLSISYEEAGRLADSPVRPMDVVAGVGGDELALIRANLAEDGSTFVIGGVSRSGKSTALLSIAQALLDSGTRVVAFTPKPSPLTELKYDERAHVFLGVQPDLAAVREALESNQPTVAIVDDLNFMTGNEVDLYLQNKLASRSQHFGIVASGRTEDLRSGIRGIAVEMRKGRMGLVLSPQSGIEGDLLGMRFPQGLVGKMPPGRAVFAKHGEAMLVQVALPRPSQSTLDDQRT